MSTVFTREVSLFGVGHTRIPPERVLSGNRAHGKYIRDIKRGFQTLISRRRTGRSCGFTNARAQGTGEEGRPRNGSEARKFPRICLVAPAPNPSIDHSVQNLSHAICCFQDPPTMSAIWNLHCLYSLDPSSPGFLRRLYSLFCYDEEERYLSRLQGSKLTRLLDFLDRVCTLLSAFHLATKQALQTLGAMPSDDNISIQCLRKLQAICGHRAALPSSYFVSGEIVGASDNPIVVGVISDVWEGIYRDKRVSIEHLKVPLIDDQARRKVRVRHGRL